MLSQQLLCLLEADISFIVLVISFNLILPAGSHHTNYRTEPEPLFAGILHLSLEAAAHQICFSTNA
jgi:hypothetical protein